MAWIMVDIEADGPAPGEYSMVSLGAVVVEEGLSRTFYGRFRPISEAFLPAALEVAQHTREETLGFPEAAETTRAFRAWVEAEGGKRPMFISDNNGFDWQFVNYYLWRFTGGNPFGHSSTNLGSLYKGMVKSVFESFKHLRDTAHTHHPVDDAIGNAEALLKMRRDLGLKINLS